MMETYTTADCAAPCACPASTIAVEMAPGPASIGIASGVTATSSLSCPSYSSSRPSWVRRSPCSMSIATYHRMSPPAVRNAASVMPKARNSMVPVAPNTTSTVIAIQARRAVRRRSAGLSCWVMTR